MSFSDNVIYCPKCGKVDEYPVCCSKEMGLDKDRFFCNICGKDMIITSKESIKGVLT